MSRGRIVAVALVTALLAMIGPAAPAEADPRTYYVAVNGSDRNPGTRKAPFRTITKGLTTLRAGDTLFIRGGTYTEHVGGPRDGFILAAPGRPGARVLVSAYKGERVVVKGLVWIDGMDYWTVQGLNVTWDSGENLAEDHMVRLRDGVGWVWQRSEIWGARSFANVNVFGTRTGQPANWALRDNCIHDNYGASGHDDTVDHLVYANTGVSAGPGVISGNLMFGAPKGKGIKVAGPYSGTGSARVTIEYNTIADTNKPSIVVGYNSHHTVIRRNLLVDTDDMALIRGYQLRGDGNIAHHNAGTAAPRMIYNDSGYERISDGGGNVFPLTPQFNATGSCSAYRPSNGTAAAYGHIAAP